MFNIDVAVLLADIATVTDPDAKRALYEAACRTVGVDREFAKKEIAALKQLAPACGVEFDERALKEFGLR